MKQSICAATIFAAIVTSTISTADDTWWALSFEYTRIGNADYRTAYGMSWRVRTIERAQILAYEECQKGATSSCEAPGEMAAGAFSDICIAVTVNRDGPTDYDSFNTYNDGGREARDRIADLRVRYGVNTEIDHLICSDD